jgi:hypothetical protein
MAINFLDLKQKLDDAPLNDVELELIKDVEDYIDKKIIDEYDKSIYGTIDIDIAYVNFNYSPKTKRSMSLGVSRVPKMSKELKRRYKEAGWVITYRSDDGMNGGDYMVLKGQINR